MLRVGISRPGADLASGIGQEVGVAMNKYRPEQRKVSAHLYTPAGWMLGTFHVPRRGGFVDHLNQAKGFFTLTEVTLTGRAQQIPFFALQRSAVIFCVLSPDETFLYGENRQAPVMKQVSCLLEMGVLHGTLEMPPQIRVSDYLTSGAGFITLRNCNVLLGTSAHGGVVEQRYQTIILNSERVIGVSDQIH